MEDFITLAFGFLSFISVLLFLSGISSESQFEEVKVQKNKKLEGHEYFTKKRNKEIKKGMMKNEAIKWKDLSELFEKPFCSFNETQRNEEVHIQFNINKQYLKSILEHKEKGYLLQGQKSVIYGALWSFTNNSLIYDAKEIIKNRIEVCNIVEFKLLKEYSQAVTSDNENETIELMANILLYLEQ